MSAEGRINELGLTLPDPPKPGEPAPGKTTWQVVPWAGPSGDGEGARLFPPGDAAANARRGLDGAPHETLLVVDATTGQNGVQQARLFAEAVEVTGVALTKLDGSAKGGIAVPIAFELGLPVKLVGVGERLEDLQPFDPETFVESLFL